MGNYSSPEYRRNRKLLLSTNPPCIRCGTYEKITADHIIPKSKGGDDSLGNLQPLCSFHNTQKHNRKAGHKTSWWR